MATRGDDGDRARHAETVEWMCQPILDNSALADAINESFSGSGSTLIVAEMTGRRCLAMEIDPTYCDVAVQRWQDLTGRDSALDGDNRPFNAIAATRAEQAAA